MSHRTPAAVALRLTGERRGTAAMPSARAFASGSSRHSAGSRQSRGKSRPKSRPLAHRRDGGHSDFLDRVEEGRLTFQGKSDGESPFGALKGFLDGLRRVLILLRVRSAGSFSTRPARPLQNCRIGGMRRCHELEPRNTRTLVSSPVGTCRAIAMSVWRTSTI